LTRRRLKEWPRELSPQTPRPRDGDVPSSPAQAVASYYRYPGDSEWWLYHDGTTWVGEPKVLPWYRKPVAWAVGRAPRWTFLVVFGLSAIGFATKVAIDFMAI
jgi:hypothetical protein